MRYPAASAKIICRLNLTGDPDNGFAGVSRWLLFFCWKAVVPVIIRAG
jgi:hypothetical protein